MARRLEHGRARIRELVRKQAAELTDDGAVRPRGSKHRRASKAQARAELAAAVAAYGERTGADLRPWGPWTAWTRFERNGLVGWERSRTRL